MDRPVDIPLRIRDRLRQWEAENLAAEDPRVILSDAGEAGRTLNLLTRARNPSQAMQLEDEPNAAFEQPFLDSDGMLDYLPGPTDFLPGDLVELLADGGRLPVLAICLGYINGYYHLYTAVGGWLAVPRLHTKFVVRDFVTKEMVQPLVDKLPKGMLSREALREMIRKKLGPDRATGAKLLDKMAKFLQQTDEILQKYGTHLEKAHDTVARTDDRYLSLEQIQAHVFQAAKASESKWPTPPHMLYAMHRTVMDDDLGFRPLDTLGSSRTWLFEVTPREDVALVKNMQKLVRLFTDIPEKVNTQLSALTSLELGQSRLGQFILKAREAIDRSRQSRDWTPYGMLGPSKETRSPARTPWSEVDMNILRFMLLWVGQDQFSMASRYHWIGSAILRATGRYKDSEYLSTTTGWTFLQEVGYITPWDLHHRFVDRLPSVELSRQGGFERLPLGPEGIRPYITPDVFQGKRHDWADLKAFAIDSKDTKDIDDAVSVEATDVPGEYWVHIHVADPASQIRHQCALGERASLSPMTLYLHGHFTNMWGVGDEVQKLFSLAPNKPCLTFSGRVNENGELLAYKITPAKLQQFVYITPQDANAAADFEDPQASVELTGIKEFTVGKLPAEKPAGREMTAPSELQSADRKSLKTLYQLGEAIHQRRLAKGALPVYPPRITVRADFDDTSVKVTEPRLMMACNGDPAIHISWQGNLSPMVSSIMQLAGEIAGKWCADRSIPVPYFTQPHVEKNIELIKAYTEKIYYPTLRRGEPDTELWVQLRKLLGPDELSTQPGPNFIMGTEGYTKVTSPLRRYSDLLAHWQIEAALVQEMERGAVSEQKLPFLRKTLEDKVFPWLRLRERVLKRLGGPRGSNGYVLQALVRAWKYPSSEDKDDTAAAASSRLPETFRLTVRTTLASDSAGGAWSKILPGSLDWFGVDAWLVPEGLGRLGLNVADVRKDDVFEVSLVDVNVHLGDVYVRAIRKISVQADEVAADGEKRVDGEVGRE